MVMDIKDLTETSNDLKFSSNSLLGWTKQLVKGSPV